MHCYCFKCPSYRNQFNLSFVQHCCLKAAISYGKMTKYPHIFPYLRQFQESRKILPLRTKIKRYNSFVCYTPDKTVSGYGEHQLLTLTFVRRILIIAALYLFDMMLFGFGRIFQYSGWYGEFCVSGTYHEFGIRLFKA
jgi:hypothetical protein